MYMLDHGHAEQEHEQEPLEEPAQAEDPANTELTKGNARCIPPLFLDFAFNYYFVLSMVVH
jgi:hypothetical protein